MALYRDPMVRFAPRKEALKLVQLNVPESLWNAAQRRAALHGLKVATWIRYLMEAAVARPLLDAWVVDVSVDRKDVAREVQEQRAGRAADFRLSMVRWDADSLEADVLWKVSGRRDEYAAHSFNDLLQRDAFRERDSAKWLIHVSGSGFWTVRQAFAVPGAPRAILHYEGATMDAVLDRRTRHGKA